MQNKIKMWMTVKSVGYSELMCEEGLHVLVLNNNQSKGLAVRD